MVRKEEQKCPEKDLPIPLSHRQAGKEQTTSDSRWDSPTGYGP